jgi:multiple sugar transport system substrate-binding protein
MTRREWKQLAAAVALVAVVALAYRESAGSRVEIPAGRSEVVFWHFWGGKDRPVVEEICRRFNASQQEFFVRPIAMPGNNLDLKFFLSVAGGDPPDLLNQDDPIVADWAHRGALVPLDELASLAEIDELREWLFPAAREIGSYDGRLYALCNGLDIRALYYNGDVLRQHDLEPPRTIEEFDRAARTIAPPGNKSLTQYGYLPDPRRLWSWGIVFGGSFYDTESGSVTADSPQIVAALDWMASYSRDYGAEQVARFRKGDQALPGAAFPLLEGRYAMIMDGQWRVSEIAAVQKAARERGEAVPNYGVVPLPAPPRGRANAGWVNGNFFVVPRGAKNPRGAWAFMRFWSGFGGHEDEAARACVAGGWIPPSQHVVEQPRFQQHLAQNPMFRTFVELAASPNQLPTPAVPGAQYFQDEVIRAAEDALYRSVSPQQALREATRRIQSHLESERDSSQ